MVYMDMDRSIRSERPETGHQPHFVAAVTASTALTAAFRLARSPEAWILAAAAASRFWDLSAKPPHFDEGINGFFVQQMWANGHFKYDPTNFHGPFFFYLLQLAELTFGRGIWAFRAATAACSVALAASAFWFRPFFGRRACLWAAAAIAASPAFSFYGRYAIHETPFVLGQILFVYGLLLWRSAGGGRSAAWMACGWALMATNKETFVVFLAVAAIAAALTSTMERVPRFALGSRWLLPARKPVGAAGSWTAALAAILAAACLFSGFGMNLAGLRDFFAAFAFWTKTGVGPSGHEKPLTYWLELMCRYEPALALGLIAAACVLLAAVFRKSSVATALARPRAPKSRRAKAADRPQDAARAGAFGADALALRFMAFLGAGLFSAYSLIPYKTPWCLMSAAWPFAFAFGWGVDRLALGAGPSLGGRFVRLRPLWARAGGAAAIALSAGLTIRLCFVRFADPKEKYVYVQTTEDWTALERKVSDLVRARPEMLAMSISVLLRDPWPLPWALGRFPNVSFGSGKAGPAPQADVILIDKDDRASVEARLNRGYAVAPFQLRDGYEAGFAYFATDVFGGSPAPGQAIVGRAPASAPTPVSQPKTIDP